jgi:hypothetical protein
MRKLFFATLLTVAMLFALAMAAGADNPGFCC